MILKHGSNQPIRDDIKIAMISYYYLPEYSGAAKQLFRLISNLKNRNVRFIIISAHLDSRWPKREVIDGSEVIRVKVRRNRKESIFLFWFGVATQLWKNRNKIDLVFINGMKPAHGIAVWFAYILGKPAVGRLSIANSDINFKGQGRIIGKIHKWFLRHANKYIAISSSLMKELIMSGFPVEKCIMIPNGVDRDKYFPVKQENRSSLRGKLDIEDTLVVLFVGVIDFRKGIDVLIRAFKKVSNVVKDTSLVLVGPQNRDDLGLKFYNEMKKLAIDSGIGKKVIFRDYSSSVASYYQAADLFVLASRQEGMPNVVIEAMACGLPVVGTQISGSEDLISPGQNGLLVPPDNDKALSDAIIKILKDPVSRVNMGNTSFKKAIRFYDINKISDTYFNVYSELLRK